ncbi:thioredoxin domain-containing protein [Candidatus Parcubacteria bacterium]|nr:thioredoxin domain-containing protein [Candidatus Parcubacteria bacterium]
MRDVNKVSKILILIAILLLCVLIVYAIFNLREIEINNQDLSGSGNSQEEPASRLLAENNQALEKAKTAENKIVRKIDNTEYVLGDFNAPIQIIIYDDFDNQFSADYFRVLKEARSYFDEKIVIAFRHFPMRSHQNSIIAALASECAGEQDLFWEMAEKLFKAKTEEKLNEENIFVLAGEVGANKDDFNECARTEKYFKKIRDSIAEADDFNVIGAPTTFINGVSYPGAYQFEDFVDSSGKERKGLKSIIEEQLGV